MFHVLVYGCAGANVGDDAILTAVRARLRSLFPEAAVTVASPTPERVVERDLHQVVRTFNQVGSFYVGRSWLRTHVPAFWRTLGAIRRADLVLIGGGGLINDIDGTAWLCQWTAPAVAARLLGKPVMALGIGAGPLRTRRGRHLSRLFARCCRTVTVRDDFSRDALVEAGVPEGKVVVTADPAFGLEGSGPRAAPGGERVGVIPRFDGFDPETNRAFVSRLIEALDARGLDWRLAAANDRDYRWSEDLLRSRRETGAAEPRLVMATALETFRAFARAVSVVVSMRMHGCILSAVEGVPSIPVHTYDPKLKTTAELFGVECIDLSGEGASRGVEGTLRALDRAAAPEQAGAVERTVRRMRERLEVHDALIARLLAPSTEMTRGALVQTGERGT